MIVGQPLEEYPGLHMVEKADGRRPILVGHRLKVTDIVRCVQDNDGSETEAAAYYDWVDADKIAAAMRYYRDHRDEVDRWISDEEEYERRAYSEWKQQQAARLP